MLDVIQPAILSVWCPLGRVAISLAHIALCPPQGATNVWGDLLLRGRRGKHDVRIWSKSSHDMCMVLYGLIYFGVRTSFQGIDPKPYTYDIV